MNALLLVLAAGIGDPAPGALQCPAPSAAKGDVKGGPPLLHTFELTHKGQAGILTITKVETGCGCLRQALSTPVLQTNETAKLTIEVNTLTQPDGPNRWQVTVAYKVESPGVPAQVGEVLLQISANLAREVKVEPPQLGFSTASEASQALVVTDTRAKPLNVLKAASSSDYLKVEVAAREPGKPQSQSIMVKLCANAPIGQRDETVVLLTDDPAYPEFRVPVRVQKRAANGVTATPETVAVRFATGQTEVSTLVQLRGTDGKSVGVASAASDHPGVMVKWSGGSGSVATVRVTVTESAATQAGSCTVRVKMGEPAGQEVVIPVAWTGVKK
jgi:hypothetical protein